MARLTREDVIAIVGPLDDARIARIIETRATAADVTEAFARLSRGGTMGELHRQAHGTVAEVYEILQQDEPPAANER